ncbi:MAG TPA: hypothetical protein VFK48_17705 [Usitatibacter sp.]|nr:hypothetical protein [Usitatibacter sp.]
MLKKLLLLLILSTGANATTFSTDYTDLWWDPAEDGWGVNVIQQGDTLFATFFIYSSGRAPSWYVASETTFSRLQAGAPVFSGPIYQTSGPWFGGPFDSATVTRRLVGSATFTFPSVTGGTLSYSIDGVTVNKNITRQTWRVNNLGGDYLGGAIGTHFGCATNGLLEEAAIISVTHSGPNISLATFQNSGSCTYSGTYQQAGKMGSASGTVACSDGRQGTFAATEMDASAWGFTAHVTAQLGGSCTWSGKLGGLKR